MSEGASSEHMPVGPQPEADTYTSIVDQWVSQQIEELQVPTPLPSAYTPENISEENPQWRDLLTRRSQQYKDDDKTKRDQAIADLKAGKDNIYAVWRNRKVQKPVLPDANTCLSLLGMANEIHDIKEAMEPEAAEISRQSVLKEYGLAETATEEQAVEAYIKHFVLDRLNKLGKNLRYNQDDTAYCDVLSRDAAIPIHIALTYLTLRRQNASSGRST